MVDSRKSSTTRSGSASSNSSGSSRGGYASKGGSWSGVTATRQGRAQYQREQHSSGKVSREGGKLIGRKDRGMVEGSAGVSIIPQGAYGSVQIEDVLEYDKYGGVYRRSGRFVPTGKGVYDTRPNYIPKERAEVSKRRVDVRESIEDFEGRVRQSQAGKLVAGVRSASRRFTLLGVGGFAFRPSSSISDFDNSKNNRYNNSNYPSQRKNLIDKNKDVNGINQSQKIKQDIYKNEYYPKDKQLNTKFHTNITTTPEYLSVSEKGLVRLPYSKEEKQQIKQKEIEKYAKSQDSQFLGKLEYYSEKGGEQLSNLYGVKGKKTGQILTGIKGGVVGYVSGKLLNIGSAIRHPVRYIKGIYETGKATITDPLGTFRGASEEFMRNPARFAGEMSGSSTVFKYTGKGIRTSRKLSPYYDPVASSKTVPSTLKGTVESMKKLEGKKVNLYSASDTPAGSITGQAVRKATGKKQFFEFGKGEPRIKVDTPKSGLGKERLAFKKKTGVTETGLYWSPEAISEGFAKGKKFTVLEMPKTYIPKSNIPTGTKSRVKLIKTEKAGKVQAGRLRAGFGDEIEFRLPDTSKLYQGRANIRTEFYKGFGMIKGQRFGISKLSGRKFEITEVSTKSTKKVSKGLIEDVSKGYKRQADFYKQNAQDFLRDPFKKTKQPKTSTRRLTSRRYSFRPVAVVRRGTIRRASNSTQRALDRTMQQINRRSPPYTPPPRLFDLNFKPKKQKQPKTKYNLGKQPKFYLPSPSALMFKATAHKGDLFTGQEVRGIPKSWLKGRKRW